MDWQALGMQREGRPGAACSVLLHMGVAAEIASSGALGAPALILEAEVGHQATLLLETVEPWRDTHFLIASHPSNQASSPNAVL